MENSSNTKTPFIPDYRIANLSAMGILGFITGCILLFYNDFGSLITNDSVFHEIKYQPRIYAEAFINKAIDSLKKETEETKHQVSKYGKTKDTDSVKIKEKLVTKYNDDSVSIKQLSTYKQFYENVAEVDTIGFKKLNNALHFQITPYLINKWDAMFCKKEYTWKNNFVILDSVDCYFKDEKISFQIGGKVAIKAERTDSDIRFITKYPSVGLWLLLILVFCSFCFICLSTAIHLKGKIVKIFVDEKITGVRNNRYYLICFLAVLVMGFLALIWNRSFYDDDIVKNLFFMNHLNASMYCVIALGSIAGAFCLAGFIYSASMLNYFIKPIVEVRNEVSKQKLVVQKLQVTTGTADPNGTPIQQTPEQLLLDTKEADQKKQESIFNSLTKIFQTYFLLASIILSLMVLCTGALFNTINSLDFIKLISNDWGYSPARGDFIYLYGGLYTIILLLVYVPAKMRFSEVDIWTDQITPTGSSKWVNILKSPFGQLKDVLVATSPLLVSIIQSLFDALFN